ncbi:terminase large subunit domain-containing protein [uncultured Paludibaculum sp.]|uniref:terminase large subunit domain-containing protein n=1 Tax=uncultured Paludibaculum sp. TaxID=1765020 RepID=UPI002AAB5BFD|nr:terminase family protein [uncultured Paludibaculum sp.]
MRIFEWPWPVDERSFGDGEQPVVDTPVEMRAPSEWAREEFGFVADTRQTEVLDCAARQVLLCCSRQWGKSTVTALRALHFAMHHPGSTTLCVAPSMRQSGMFLAKVRKYLKTPAGRDPREPMSVRLNNGSSIIGLPSKANTIRGFDNVGLLILDEAAMIDDEIYTATRPMRAVCNGRLWLLSTPHGQSGFFYDAWQDRDEGWTRFSVTAPECPRLTAEFLAREHAALGERLYAQEYLCEFLPSDYQMIPSHLVDRAVNEDEEPMEEVEWTPPERDQAPSPAEPQSRFQSPDVSAELPTRPQRGGHPSHPAPSAEEDQC